MAEKYDVVIIGAGQAGMFAAYELLNDKKLKIILVDQGKDIKNRHCPMKETIQCAKCSPCNIMCGVGGAGTYSDGTLNLRYDIGGNLMDYTKDEHMAMELVEEVDKIYLKFGCPTKLYGTDVEGITDLKRRAASLGVKFVDIPQRHIGTDKAPVIIDKFAEYLKENGVDFSLQAKVDDLIIENDKCVGIKLVDGKEIRGKYVLIAPGRVGAQWLNEVVNRHKIKAKCGPIDVGVRVEVSSLIMDPVIKINRDPKFHIRSKTYDDFVRTFCTNYEGYVVKEKYDSFIGVNGHSMSEKKSGNTNFAFLVRVELTEPVEDTIKYGRSIAKLASNIGGGKPMIQRLGDLKKGKRSKLKAIMENPVQNTLKDVTPGDISMALPHRIVTDVIEGLDKLNEVIPGVASDSTLLYAPEIKFYATQVAVNSNMETSVANLFAAGDGAGLSRDIVNAAATGILAAKGILNKIKAG
jgi:uncharacterized FAD-dependent dehydrogenase